LRCASVISNKIYGKTPNAYFNNSDAQTSYVKWQPVLELGIIKYRNSAQRFKNCVARFDTEPWGRITKFWIQHFSLAWYYNIYKLYNTNSEILGCLNHRINRKIFLIVWQWYQIFLELIYHPPLCLLQVSKCFINMNNRSYASDNDNIGYIFFHIMTKIKYNTIWMWQYHFTDLLLLIP